MNAHTLHRFFDADGDRDGGPGLPAHAPSLQPRGDRPAGTTVYLMRDADHEVIYVGMTNNIKDRMRHHEGYSPWIAEVAYIETSTPYLHRQDAADFESIIAAGLRPKYNSQLVPGRRAEQKRARWSA